MFVEVDIPLIVAVVTNVVDVEVWFIVVVLEVEVIIVSTAI